MLRGIVKAFGTKGRLGTVVKLDYVFGDGCRHATLFTVDILALHAVEGKLITSDTHRLFATVDTCIKDNTAYTTNCG